MIFMPWLSLQNLIETFLNLRRTELAMIIDVFIGANNKMQLYTLIY
jgi:hypothetical protein